MSRPEPANIRNVCIVGHGDAGKTTLADGLLHKAGAVSRLGSVKDRTSVFDFDELEREKGHSLESAIASCEWEGVRINIIDTPGYPDFVGDAVAAIAASDGVVICVNAAHGVQVNTRRVYDIAEKLNKARIIAFTKCDTPGVDFDRCVEDVQTWFGQKCIPVTIPEGFGADFHATTKLLKEKGKSSESAMAHYLAFVEAAVVVDDAIVEKYLDGKELTDDELRSCFPRAVAEGILTPLLTTSSEKDVGLRDILDAVKVFVPAADVAARRRRVFETREAEGEGVKLETLDPKVFYGQVFKVHIDKHVGKTAFVHVYAGTLSNGDVIHNADGAKKEKIGHMSEPMGKELRPIEKAGVGDIVALPKIDHVTVGDTISTADRPKWFRPFPFPKPMTQLAVRPASRGDETKISEAFTKLAAEMPTFSVHRDPVTHEAIASGMSPLHLDTAFHRLKDRYGIAVETSPARIPYREAVTSPSEGHYRHKKQSGGRGQFAEVYLRVRPGEPDSGLTLDWDIVGGSIPSNFAPAIEKGVREKMLHGVIAGYPIRDVHVSVHDGKFHDVDSSEAAFKIAGGRAFAEAVKKARPVLLEPLVEAEIVVPADNLGDITGDLNTRRGRIQGMDAKGSYQVVTAIVPRAEMAEYSRVLNSLTSGEGSFSQHEIGYEQVPAHVQQQIVQEFKPKDDDEA